MNDLEKRKYVMADLDDIEFPDGQMTGNWYNGHHALEWLIIKSKQLHAIHSGAFNCSAIRKLRILDLQIRNGLVQIHAGAFSSFVFLWDIRLKAKSVKNLAAGIFEPLAVSLNSIICKKWPSNVDLNEMFANQKFYVLKTFYIENVDWPQAKFRQLHATNFTAFRRVKELYLINCGIETIDRHAFDVIGRTLRTINLDKNWIKLITFDMFRIFFEASAWEGFTMEQNREPWQCSCELIEIEAMRCPFGIDFDQACFECDPIRTFDAQSCGVHRDVDFDRWCIAGDGQSELLRVIEVRMALRANSIVIQTNFTSKFRVIFVSGDALAASKCADRANNATFKCVSVDKFVERLELGCIAEIRHAELVLITAIPILADFGARPMHSIVVRREMAHRRWGCRDWAIVSVAMVMGAVLGFFGCICAWLFITHLTNLSQMTNVTAYGNNEFSYYHEIDSVREENELSQNEFDINATTDDYGYYNQSELSFEAVPNDYL